ncbi:DUF4352 domain-containing protein [Bacillaceae bacterium Marseille-Q3522]|nr:DUF4352 domain-containing protein [Bacillaceae bacterium Marseille-Q3522]
MNKKRIAVLSIFVIAFIIWGVRVYQVNAGVAKKYHIETFGQGDTITIGNATLQVTDFQYGELEKENDFEYYPLTITMVLHNTSDESMSLVGIIYTKLAYGMSYYQTIEGDYDSDQLQRISPDETINITLIYDVKPEDYGKKAMLYIDQGLYADQVEEQYKKGKRYGIAVEL